MSSLPVHFTSEGASETDVIAVAHRFAQNAPRPSHTRTSSDHSLVTLGRTPQPFEQESEAINGQSISVTVHRPARQSSPSTEFSRSISSNATNGGNASMTIGVEANTDPTPSQSNGNSRPAGPSGRRMSQLQLDIPADPSIILHPVPQITQSSLNRALESPGPDPDERPNPIPQRDLTPHFDIPGMQAKLVTSNGGLASIAAKVLRGKANEYEYTPLVLSDQVKIRILRIEEGSDNAPIICSLIPSSLSEPYEALSYVWGDDEPTEEIKIREAAPSSNAHKSARIFLLRERSFYVRPNLYAALRNFRSRKNHVNLWVDALCIDQDNDEEKETQVAMMEEIYGKASRVLIWLGEPRPFSADAFDCIEQMCDLSLFDGLLRVDNPANTPLLQALGQLMTDVWFSRRWVVQELALAKTATLHCGRLKIHWEDFADAIAFYVMSYDRIKTLPQAPKTPDRPKPLPEVKRLGPSVLVDVTSNLFRRSLNEDIIERRQTLEALVSSLTAYEASDPRDTIYAVLSLAKDTYRPYPGQAFTEVLRYPSDPAMGHGLRPEYEKDLFEVCKDFIQSCVLRPQSPSLDIICRHWCPVPRKFTKLEQADILKKIELHDKNWLYERKLASWMPSIKGASFGTPKDAFQGRVNGDSLVGIQRANYNATPGCILSVSFRGIQEDQDIRVRRNRAKAEESPIAPRTVSDGTMSVRGVRLDTIDKLSQRCDEATIFEECLEIGKWDEDNPTVVPDALWRTMVADRGPNGTPAPNWYKRACRHAIAKRTPNNDVRTTRLISDRTDSLGVEFLKRVRDVIWNRKFFSTENEGRLGLAPKKAEKGDIVCIFYGCSVPVLIRKIRHREEYEFIGECYLHGMMDGEAVSSDRTADLQSREEDFLLR